MPCCAWTMLAKRGQLGSTRGRCAKHAHRAVEIGYHSAATQLAVLRGSPVENELVDMKRGEDEHLQTMDRLLLEHRARPSALLPLWNLAGYALGTCRSAGRPLQSEGTLLQLCCRCCGRSSRLLGCAMLQQRAASDDAAAYNHSSLQSIQELGRRCWVRKPPWPAPWRWRR